MRAACLATLLLAYGACAWADEAQVRTRQLPSGVNQKDRPTNITREEASPDNLKRSELQPDKASSTPLQDKVLSTTTHPGNVLRMQESEAQRMHSAQESKAPEPAAQPDLSQAPPLATTSQPKPKAPDMRPLWRMLEQHRYAELLARLQGLQAANPEWQPPPRLVALAREGEIRQSIEDAIRTSDSARLIMIAGRHPEAFSCRQIAQAWALGETHASRGEAAEAEGVVRRLLSCPNEDDRLATLYKARDWLATERWEQLLALEEGMVHSVRGEERVRLARYQYRLQRLVAASEKGNSGETQQAFAALAAEAETRKDAGAALLGAWSHYQAGEYARATDWFSKVLQWKRGHPEAHRGLALCALQEKRLDAALQHAQSMPPGTQGRAELMRDILVAQAQEANSAGRYEQAQRLLASARTHAALPRHAQLLAAWSNLELHKPDAAADEFLRLYREAPDQESAQGLLAGMTRAGRGEELRQIAQAEPLKSMVRQQDAEQAFSDKRFLAARSLSPERYAALGAAAAPQLLAGVATRGKSGSDGMSRLDLQVQPAIEAAIPAGPRSELRLRIEHVRQDSGALPANAPVGQVPLSAASYTEIPTTAASGWQPRLIWHDETGGMLDAELGMTPSGGSVAAQWTGRLSWQGSKGGHDWQAGAYREAVRESILSYTGLRDPYQGAAWGRVLRNGLRAGARLHLDERWGLNVQAGAEALNGSQVAGNHRFYGDAGVAYSLGLHGFDYAVFGAGISGDHYAKNLSQFTFGHGGYFSPQRYWRAGPSFDFMSEENRGFILKGRISAGRTGKREDATPFFPLAPDGRMFNASSGTGNAWDAELAAVWRVNDYVQFGALAATRHSPQYKDHAALAFLRITFEARRSSLSSDLRALDSRDLY